MAYAAKKSSYGNNNSSSKSSSNSDSGSSESVSKTTHYAYTLDRDSEGNLLKDDNGKISKTFVNDILIFENSFTTKDGSTFTNLKIIPTADLPAGTEMYVVKKKAK